MASKKKNNVVRCGICGVRATQVLGTGLHICNNIVCYHAILNRRDLAVAYGKNKK